MPSVFGEVIPSARWAVDISTHEDEYRSLLGVSYNTLSAIMTHHDVTRDILVRIAHNGQACGAGDASASSNYVQRAVRQVAVSFYVRDCPSPRHARECVSFFSPLSLPLSSSLSPSPSPPKIHRDLTFVGTTQAVQYRGSNLASIRNTLPPSKGTSKPTSSSFCSFAMIHNSNKHH